MVRKKAVQTSKKKRKKHAQVKEADYVINLVGLALVLLSILADFKLGLVGRFCANLYRILVGNGFQVLAVVVTIVGLSMFVLGRIPRLAGKQLWGIIFVTSSLLMLMHAALFKQLQLSHDLVHITWRMLAGDIAINQVASNVGGGMLGAWLLTLFQELFSMPGTYLLCGLLIICGILMILNVQIKQVVMVFQKMISGCQWLGNYLKTAYQEQPVHEPHLTNRKLKPQRSATESSDHNQPAVPKTEPATQGDDDFKIETPPTLKPVTPNLQPVTSSVSNEYYQLPDLSLLKQVPPADQSQEYALIDQNRKKLKETLASFGVEVEVKKATLGPTVTKYEIQPAVGVKVSRIVNLADDLALALAAKDLRIEAPIPGKPYIGIEVPNQTPSMVSFREIIENQPEHAQQVLAVPLGKDVYGQIAMCDLAQLPHLLIAGSTGSGKSVAINTIITGLLMQASPQVVKMILIDPKIVELSMYNGIPHLLIPVVTDAKKANSALQKAVQEMERRYQLFEQTGYRKIEEYNQAVEQNNQDKTKPVKEKLPYIIIVVDELSDLMMVAGRDVENSIVRLAQKARAAGMHLILATQRPSVDVITGLIKANIPSRMAFAVSSNIDSRTILDSPGAEKLLGRGDMLFEPIGQNKPSRIQGAYISTEEVERVVDFVKQQQAAAYDEQLLPSDQAEATNSQQVDDEYWQEAVELVAREQKASVSMLQRRFQIGYNRAARLVDAMEERGIVGPAQGSKSRKVLIDRPEIEDIRKDE